MFEAGWISMYEMPDMGNMTSTRVTLLPTVGWVEIYLRDENDNERCVFLSCVQAECVHYCIRTCQTQPNILHCLQAYHTVTKL